MPVLDLTKGEVVDDIKPLVFVISDARGETANVVVKAAAAQFGHDSVEIVRLANADTIEAVSTVGVIDPEEFLQRAHALEDARKNQPACPRSPARSPATRSAPSGTSWRSSL